MCRFIFIRENNKLTNHCESFHAKISDLFTSAHPHIVVFIKNILVIQTDSYIRMNSANDNESRIILEVIKKLTCNSSIKKLNYKIINKLIVICIIIITYTYLRNNTISHKKNKLFCFCLI